MNQFTKVLQAPKTVWQAIIDVLQKKRLEAKRSPVEALVTEMFLTSEEAH
ncbi:MAG: hypothetical protein ACE5R6_20175 [Candidatus Heimdallarchaeota archaeon]